MPVGGILCALFASETGPRVYKFEWLQYSRAQEVLVVDAGQRLQRAYVWQSYAAVNVG